MPVGSESTSTPAPVVSEQTPAGLSRRPATPGAPQLAEVGLAVGESGPPAPQVLDTPPFLYAWHPSRYQVVGGRVLPFLRTVPLQAGINNVVVNAQGKFILKRMKAHLEARGWTLIPWKKGPGGESYMQSFETKLASGARKTGYLPVFAKIYPGSREIGSDTERFGAWLAELVDNGTVPPCPAHIAEQLHDQLHARYAAMEERIARGESRYRRHADQLGEQLASVEYYIEQTRKPLPQKAGTVDLED